MSALREAIGRVADFAAGFECDVASHLVAGSVAREHAADLRRILAAIEQMREALRLARDFAEQEIECRGYAGGEMTDYQDEAQQVFDACDAVLWQFSPARYGQPPGAEP